MVFFLKAMYSPFLGILPALGGLLLFDADCCFQLEDDGISLDLITMLRYVGVYYLLESSLIITRLLTADRLIAMHHSKN